jgi:choline dehydrogenase-like flavoprotein
MPHAENRITLAPDRSDSNGNPLAQIEWRVRDPDVEAFRAIQSALRIYWAESAFASLGSLTPTPEELWQGRLREGADIYHPGGSTRIGTDPSNGVLDAELKTFRVDNLYVISTSAFPSGGSANPSFMLMAFALRAAERIACELRATAG